jgi:hypothetical protein
MSVTPYRCHVPIFKGQEFNNFAIDLHDAWIQGSVAKCGLCAVCEFILLLLCVRLAKIRRRLYSNPSCLVPPFTSKGAPRQTAWETSVKERSNYGREMADQISPCRKSATLDRRLYFPSEGRHAVDFFRPNKSDGFGRVWTRDLVVPEGSMLTTRPPKPLSVGLLRSVRNYFQTFMATCDDKKWSL